MATLTCDTCGNTKRWRNLWVGYAGAWADCKTCGDQATDPEMISPRRLRILDTDNTELQNLDTPNDYL